MARMARGVHHVLDGRLTLAHLFRPIAALFDCGVVPKQASAHYARAVELDSGNPALRSEAAAVASVRRHIEQGAAFDVSVPEGWLRYVGALATGRAIFLEQCSLHKDSVVPAASTPYGLPGITCAANCLMGHLGIL